MRERLNWGILGTSFISGVMAEAIRAEGGTEIYAVAGRSARSTEALAAGYGVEKVFLDYDELIADPRVDVVYIALPNHLHHEYVARAASAGKAILCEKSLSIDMERSQRALTAVEQHQVFFAEGLMYLTHPLARKIVDLVHVDRIGELRAMSGQYCAAISEFVNPDSKGAIFNLGCYPASLAHLVLQQLGGDQTLEDFEITATRRRGDDGNICETAASLQFEGGVVCQLHTAEDYGLHAEFTVLGSKGSLRMKSNPWLPDTSNQLVLTEYEQPDRTFDVAAEGNGFFYQVRQVREALEQGRLTLSRPAARPSDSLEIMRLLTRWERAAS